MSFWNKLQKPIVGMSAMDGITDAAMRQTTALYGTPDVMMTEFTSADGIMRSISRLLRDFYFTNRQRPIIAQLFGIDPAMFRLCAVIVCELGFDGVDINMGCPAPSIAAKGGGASLIKQPKLAQEIVRATQAGVLDWVNGKSIDDLSLDPAFVARVKAYSIRDSTSTREALPISVKTRIGYDTPVVHEWMPRLLETNPVVISLHGRTLDQHYSGQANWEEIAKAAEIVHQTDTLILGNGDIHTPLDIVTRIKETKVDGVLVGRATMGNPWFFTQWNRYINGQPPLDITPHLRFEAALQHCLYFEELNRTAFADDPLPFLNMRKHLGWYIKGFRDATDMRVKLFSTNSSHEVKAILDQISPVM